MVENWHDAGSEWAAEGLTQSAGRIVEISDGTTTVEVSAVVGRTEVEQWEDQAAGGTFTSTDFSVLAADLDFLGTVKLPAIGWTVLWDRAGVVETYQVLKLPGKDCYTPCGQYRESLRIHTKLTART